MFATDHFDAEEFSEELEIISQWAEMRIDHVDLIPAVDATNQKKVLNDVPFRDVCLDDLGTGFFEMRHKDRFFVPVFFFVKPAVFRASRWNQPVHIKILFERPAQPQVAFLDGAPGVDPEARVKQ